MKTCRPDLPFEVISNPEFLSAGTAISDLVSPSRVLIGSQQTTNGRLAAAALERVYSWVHPSKVMHTNTYSSELAKLVANAMLAQRISSINSISAICEKTGADINEISNAVGADSRIGAQYLKAGIGFGGSCFGKDIRSLVYLAETLGLPEVAEYWQQVLSINDWQVSRFARKVVQKMNGTLVGKKIAVLGYAFKKGTDDTRESPALNGIRILLEDTPREVAIYDPFCDPCLVRKEIESHCGSEVLKQNGGPVEVYGNAYEACAQSHAVIVMTDCDEFSNRAVSTFLPPLDKSRGTIQAMKEPGCGDNCLECRVEKEKATKEFAGKERVDWAKVAYHLQKPRWVLDGRGILDVTEMEKLDVRVEAIGRVSWGGL